MVDLSQDQQNFYKQVLDRTKKDIDNIDKQMDDILEEVKQRLAVLQNNKKVLIQMYNSAATVLGVRSEYEEEEGEEDQS